MAERDGRGEKFFAPTIRLPFIARRPRWHCPSASGIAHGGIARRHPASPVAHGGIAPAPLLFGIRRHMVGVIPIGAHRWSPLEHYHRWYDAASNCRWGSDKALKARASGPRLVSDGSRFGLYLHCSHSCNFNSVHGSQDYETLPSLDCAQLAR
jgi:hypothetical protein